MKNKFSIQVILRFLFITFLVFVTLKIRAGNEPYILHSINLIFHEAGHMVFMFFGEFIYVLGGTLMQLLVPLTFLIYFARYRQWYSVSIMWWWIGTNFVDIGIYISDAQIQILPLLGGGNHDWYYLLTRMGLLQKEYIIGGAVSSAGTICMFGALLTAFYIILSQAGAVKALRCMARK